MSFKELFPELYDLILDIIYIVKKRNFYSRTAFVFFLMLYIDIVFLICIICKSFFIFDYPIPLYIICAIFSIGLGAYFSKNYDENDIEDYSDVLGIIGFVLYGILVLLAFISIKVCK